MTSISDDSTLSYPQLETKRICDSLRGKISQEERDRLYGTIACLSRSAYNRGQFPTHKVLTEPRESIGARLTDTFLSIFSREIFEFQKPFKEITSFESDAKLISLHNSLNMLEVDTRTLTRMDIMALVQASYDAGLTEEVLTEEPMTILGGISTW